MKTVPFLSLVVSLFLLSACSPKISPPATLSVSASPLPSFAAPPAMATSAGDSSAAVAAAKDALATRLHVGPSGLTVQSATAVQWPDSCLGAAGPDEMCAMIVTPGWRIVLSASGADYEFHTNRDGSEVWQALSPLATPTIAAAAPFVLVWQGGDSCDELRAAPDELLYGPCGKATTKAQFPNAEYAQRLDDWRQTYVGFSAQTPAGALVFEGAGKTVATPAEQRMMAEWASLLFGTAQSGRGGAAWGLALDWHRQGGLAGFCDEVAVYLDGSVHITNCKGLNASATLTASQLELFYSWLDGLQPIDYKHSDPGSADQMTVSLTFKGNGPKKAENATIQAIIDFAASLQTQAQLRTQGGDSLKGAQQTLQTYLKALNRGDYATAAGLYGGDTSLLRTWNPDVQGDLPKLFQRACAQSGLLCMAPRSITYDGLDSQGIYHFFVEFDQPDGTLFHQGPCCGETNAPAITAFRFSVIEAGSGWQVLDLPPSIP